MRKFKLAKIYPGVFINAGDLVVDHDGIYFPENGGNGINPKYVENYPEFWEEVKKFPKIISFRSLYLNKLNVILRYDGEKCISRSDGMDPKYTISYSTALVDPKCEIYQVAVSETEVFTLGDKVIDGNNPNQGSFAILGFEYEPSPNDKEKHTGVITLLHDHKVLGKWLDLTKLKKAPEPLFVTEDNIPMFKGDKFYYISISLEHFSNCYSGYAQEGSAANTNYKYFSTVEAAKKYFDENKPIYSKKQIEDTLTNTFMGTSNGIAIFAEIFKRNIGL